VATYGFLPFDVLAGTPLPGEPVLAEGLFSVGVATGSPSLNQPTLGQVETLAATDVVAGEPFSTIPGDSQTNVFSAANVRVNWPFFRERPALAEKTPITATDVVGTAGTVSEPTATIRRDLFGTDVAAATPSTGAPTLTRNFLLTTFPVFSTRRPSTSLATLVHVHALTSVDVTSGAPLLDVPGQVTTHALVAAGGAAGVDTLLLSGDEQSGTDALLLSGDEQSGTDGVAASGDEQSGAVSNGIVSAGTPATGTPTLAERQDSAQPTDVATSAPSVDNPTLDQVHYLAGNDIASANPTTDVAFTSFAPGTVVLIALGNDILEPDRPFHDGDQGTLGYESFELEGDLSGRLIYEGDQSVATLYSGTPTAEFFSGPLPVETEPPTVSEPYLGPLRLTAEGVTSVPTVSEPSLREVNFFYTDEIVIYVPPDDPDPMSAEDVTETIRVPAEARTVTVPSDNRTIRVPARRVTFQTRRE